MSATIHSVAERAGVSVSAASRALNGRFKGARGDAMKRAEAVRKAARDLGYTPNSVARGLVMKKTFTIGFIATELSNPVRAKLIEDLRVRALEKGYQLLTAGVQYGDDISGALDSLLSRRIDGLLTGNISGNLGPLRNLAARGFPLAGFSHEKANAWDTVFLDYSGLTRGLAQHLIKNRGLKRVIFGGPRSNYPRSLGYTKAIKDAGLEKYGFCLDCHDFSMPGGHALAERCAAMCPLPEAVVCHNDLLAIGLMAGLRAVGLKVPDDIAVTGMDNIEMASYTNPLLTTAGVDSPELASLMMDFLFARIGGEHAFPRRVELTGKIFIRESCGASQEKNSQSF
jgi:LacI family transcriptional regulator